MVGCVCICLSQVLAESLREQLYLAPVCKHILTSPVMSGIVSADKMDLMVEQSLDGLSFCQCSIFVPPFPLDRNNPGLKILRLVCGPIPQVRVKSTTGGGFFSFYILTVGDLGYCHLHWVLETSHIPGV